MAEPSEQIFTEALARLALMEQVVRLLLRERAATNGQTPDDIRRWADEIKVFFASRMPPGIADANLITAVDRFFAVLASDVAQDRGIPVTPRPAEA